MTQGPDTAAYLSLFGGNEDGSTWWGDYLEEDPLRHESSQFQALTVSLPITGPNVQRMRDAASNDLAWCVGQFASDVAVSISVPAVNRIGLSCDIIMSDTRYTLPFTVNS